MCFHSIVQTPSDPPSPTSTILESFFVSSPIILYHAGIKHVFLTIGGMRYKLRRKCLLEAAVGQSASFIALGLALRRAYHSETDIAKKVLSEAFAVE